jgi:isoquinoline 1-oxidoreductase subunit beta
MKRCPRYACKIRGSWPALAPRAVRDTTAKPSRRRGGANRCPRASIAASEFHGYGTYSAAVAEVSVTDGKLKVHRLVLGINCGHAVCPDQIVAQMEGSVAFGLSAALYGEMSVKDGRMVQTNFDTYQLVRMAEMPKVETVIMQTHDFWGGVGEPTICVVTPAVLNAIHAATGKPVRSLPLKNVKLV